MATWQYELAEPPPDGRTRELWLQHAAGFILFEDVRRHALERIDPNASSEARQTAQKAIDDALGGLMQVIDGVTGGLANPHHCVFIDFIVRLERRDEQPAAVVSSVDLRDGDGMCMGFHGWLEGDFGSRAIAARTEPQQKPQPEPA